MRKKTLQALDKYFEAIARVFPIKQKEYFDEVGILNTRIAIEGDDELVYRGQYISAQQFEKHWQREAALAVWHFACVRAFPDPEERARINQ